MKLTHNNVPTVRTHILALVREGKLSGKTTARGIQAALEEHAGMTTGIANVRRLVSALLDSGELSFVEADGRWTYIVKVQKTEVNKTVMEYTDRDWWNEETAALADILKVAPSAIEPVEVETIDGLLDIVEDNREAT